MQAFSFFDCLFQSIEFIRAWNITGSHRGLSYLEFEAVRGYKLLSFRHSDLCRNNPRFNKDLLCLWCKYYFVRTYDIAFIIDFCAGWFPCIDSCMFCSIQSDVFQYKTKCPCRISLYYRNPSTKCTILHPQSYYLFCFH